MLESMRSVQNSLIGKIGMALIFLLIIVGLSFFGFADLFRTSSATWVARVGNRDISVETYRRGYQIAMQQLEQRLRKPVTSAQARQYGLDQQVLSRLVTDTILDVEADKLGLAISEAQIGKAVVDDPTFAGPGGKFDRDRFNTLLRNNGLTEQSFLRDQRQTYLRQELVDGVAGALSVPKAALDALHRLQAETRSIDMIVLPPTLVGDVPAPDAAALQTYYDAHKSEFSAPEFRKLVILATSPATVAKPEAVSEAEMRRLYEADEGGRFGQPERRTLKQIVFPNEADAQAASAQIKAGKSFADAAAERNVSGKELDLGAVTKGSLFDKAVADAAFALPADGTSDPIKGTFGTVLIHVTAIEAGTKKTFEEVAPAIRQEIANSAARTRDALRDLHDKIEDQRASGKTLAEAAKAVGLEVRTVDAVDATGHDPAGALVDIPDRDDVLRAAFASDVGVDTDVVQSRAGDQIWFEVAGIDPAHQRKFDEVKAQVEQALRKDEIAKRLVAKADEWVKALNGGQTMEQVAASANNAEIKHASDLKRAGADDVPGPVAVKAFDTAVGSAGSADGSDGSRILFKVLDSVVPTMDPDAPETEQLQGQYRNLFADDILAAYLSRLEGTMTIKINPTVLNSAIGGDNG
ncbi:SurA N-terminal domain-containing protein [Lichenifustis flavocetrariae]|uniref:Parvulin-like PPIase n=1 Tax=Lichenifustis flavocetrariae TaxID=2949735 RepID=A0AA41Z175_9HYPH|nr:SurA N-terminal domain-containing protein [Lichenifustis flavocetrariae]MCW6511096.1 SurA N-terminal domain-containing protein [Lichenifustis flavocetrariae]